MCYRTDAVRERACKPVTERFGRPSALVGRLGKRNHVMILPPREDSACSKAEPDILLSEIDDS